MIINIGSKNPVKISAVKNAFSHYFKNIQINSVKVNSGVSSTPLSLKETIQGAKNRAKNTFKNCDFSIGIEAGFFESPGSDTGYHLTSYTAIYDGKRFYLGGSPILELPKKIVQEVLKGKELGLLIDDAMNLKNNKQKIGVVGILTKGILHRQKALEQGIITALCPIINKKFYKDDKKT